MEQQNNIQLNTFEGGMDMDTDVSFMAKNTYRYSQNMRLVTQTDGTNGVLQNIEYIKKYPEIEELKTQNIIKVITAKIPDETGALVNTAILLTQEKTSKSHNNIYLVSDFNKSTLNCKCVLKTIWHLDKDSNVSMVYNYETSSVYKLYLNDASSGLKIINLADYRDEWGDKPIIENPSYFNSTPSITLPPMELKGYVSGNLKAGAYQYFYKLYTSSGIESNLSPASEVIYLAENSFDDAIKSGGFSSEFITQYGISLELSLTNDQFDYIKCYRVYWKDNINDPTVELFLQDRMKKGDVSLTINDALQQVLNSITLEELNDIIPYTFQAQILQQYKNRLFFANIESTSWDIPEDYDTRAYRANYDGKVTLTNASGNTIVNNVSLDDIINGTYVIEDDFDAINPMNAEMVYPLPKTGNEYAYDRAHNYGGEGKNIAFTIVYAETYEAPYYTNNLSSTQLRNSKVGYTTRTSNNIRINATGGSNKQYSPIQLSENTIISYANPLIASKFASYQRDETYRFGIIFYDQRNIPTPVHWICDIRFPSGDTDGFGAFAVHPDNKSELVARPLGVNFEIKNFPDGAVSAEIVRCDRTSSDRTIVAQGMLNNTIYFTGFKLPEDFDPNESNGTNDIRSNVIPTCYNVPQWMGKYEDNEVKPNTNNYSNRVCNDVKLFVSPETVFNSTSKVIESGYYICPVYKSYCAINDTQEFTNTSRIAVDASKLNGSDGYDALIGLRTFSGICLGDKNSYNSNVESVVVKYYINQSANTALNNQFNKYNKIDNYNKFIATVEEAKPARTDLPNQDNNGREAFKNTYIDIINGKNYTNNAVGVEVFCIGGINYLIGIDSSEVSGDHLLYGGYDSGEGLLSRGESVVTMICNIKKNTLQYGGNSYLARSTNAYISCGGYLSSSDTNVTIFGGDTFLTNFCYQNASVFTKNDFNEDGRNYHKSVFVYLPVESTINTYMRFDESFMQSYNTYLHTNPGTINGVSQDFAMYAYNSCYSVSDGGVNYMNGSTNNNIGATEFNRYRIVCSEQKSAGEAIDSWSKSKFANTLDVDSKYGSMTQLVEYNNQLLALQENALNQISVNERSLISDSNGAALVLGTGGVLNRYDIIITNYGAGIINDPSVITSSQNVYWFDNNKNVICSYGQNGFHILSKEKKVQSFVNSLTQVDNLKAISFFNDKDNELWIRLKGNCLVYNEQADQFTSFYTHIPDFGLRFYDRLVTLKNNQFYYTNSYGEEQRVEELTAKLKIVINEQPFYTKVFDTQQIVGNIEDPNNTVPQVLTSIKFSTKTQNSLEIDYNSVQCREDDYTFIIPRQDRGLTGGGDEDKQDTLNRSFAPRMRGKYLIGEYEFNCDNDRSVQIPFIKTMFRQSSL